MAIRKSALFMTA